MGMKPGIVLLALLGIGLAVYFVGRAGLGAVVSAVLAVGWGGFAILCAYALALFMLLGAAWYVLAPATPPSQMPAFIWGRLVRDSAAEVLPFSQVGGFLLGARAAMFGGIAPPLAFASTIVDVSAEMVAQLAYAALGIGLLFLRAPDTSFTRLLGGILAAGLILAAVAGTLFIVVQRRGIRFSERLVSHWFPKATLHTAAMAAAIDAIYTSPARVGFSIGLHFAAWLASALGTWIAFFLIGVPIDLEAVLAIESLVYAMRSAAFVVPNGLGVQEAAYALLTPLFGVGPEMGIAVSVLKRARDIAIGIPILIIWQAMEGHRVLVPGRRMEEP
jgi:putative membrane protein